MAEPAAAAGTLVRPGPVGRIVRLALGALIAYGLFSFIMAFPGIREVGPLPSDPMFYVPVVFLVFMGHYVVDIGLGIDTKRLSQAAIAAALGAALGSNIAVTGAPMGPIVAWTLLGLYVLIFVPLTIAFPLAAVLGTPGCEMRAYAHLMAIIGGRDATERFCPGLIDRWDHIGARAASGREEDG